MPARSAPLRYWLFKSEAGCYSIDDLAAERRHTTFWDGVRNYQARNLLRDEIAVGDRVFFYHSSSDPLAIVGTMDVVRAGYGDHTALDPQARHFDPKSNPDAPTWYMVDVRLRQKFDRPITLAELKADARLKGMALLQRGSRLSIQPVSAREWKIVHELAGASDR
jgi:predicted RNA-binding protein with PUA-like domain